MKKILTLFTVLLLLGSFTVVRAATTRIYCKMEYSWWTKDGARIGIILDSGSASAMTLVSGSGNTWYADVDLDGHTTIKFRRIGSSNTDNWGAETTAQNISSNSVGTTNNFFTITNSSDTWSGNSQYCNGTWGTYVYTPPTIKLHGNFSGSWNDTPNFTKASGNATASWTNTIYAGNYEFGVKIDDVWTANGVSFNRANPSRVVTSGSSNITFAADVTGEYTFTWTFETSTLEITYPAEPVLEDYTIYFKNTPGWTNVYVYIYSTSKTFGENGVGENDAVVRGTMSKIDDGPFYKYDFQAYEEYTKVCFNNELHDGTWNTFWQDDCSWSDSGLDFDNDMVLWIPNLTPITEVNSCNYYNSGTWSVYPPIEPGVAFSGLSSNVCLGQEVTFAAISENVNTPTYTYYVKQGEGEYGDAVSSYTFNEAGSYTVKVEVRENGAGEALAYATQTITCTKYSLMQNDHTSSDKGSEVAVFSTSNGTTLTANWTCPSAGTYYFYASKDASSSAHENCDYLNGSQTFTDGSNIQVYLYGNATGCYGHSFTLNAPRAGQYTFTLTLGDPIYFKCDYPEALDAEVNLDALPSVAYKDDAFTLADYVASVNVVQPEYTFFVKKGDADYGSAVASYTFAETGTYTVKAEVREQGAGGDALDDVEKSITIYEEPLTLYFVNKEDWSNIHAYVYGDGDIKNAAWPGELMTATGDETDRNHYAVYSIIVPKDIYTTAIFNNGNGGFPDNQTGDMAIDNTKPYYYDGDWYATLAECDQPVLTTHFYLAGSFNNWSGTANRFMKATEDATTASVTITVSEYSDIEFKVIDNGSWCGAASAVTLDKDHNTITIPTTDGSNFGLTPYAAGDYIFTLDLSTRELTVTYPSGDPMPVPTNFYLAGTFNGWNTTADRFMKASPDATTASVTINIAEYINITMKVMEGSAYCGGATAIDKDNTSVTIAAAGQGNDIAMTPYAAGDYIFTFDLSTRELTVTYPSGDPMPIPQNIYLLGIESWDESDDYKFSVSGDVATLEVENMTAQHEYEFKLKYNGAWFGANYNFKYYWCSDVVFSAGADNAKLNTFKAGTYTFTLKISTMELTIGFPPTAATSVSVSQYEYATLYSDKALDVPDEVEAFVVTGHEGIRLTLEPIYRIPANTGVLLHAPQGNYNFYEGDARWIDPVATNYLKGTLVNQTIDNELIHYVLSYNNDFQVGFYWPYGTGATQGVGAFTNNAGKAYLELPSQPASVVARQGFTFVNTTDSTTGLEDVTTDGESVKVLRNGMLLIIHNGQVFNAQGARVQ